MIDSTKITNIKISGRYLTDNVFSLAVTRDHTPPPQSLQKLAIKNDFLIQTCSMSQLSLSSQKHARPPLCQ